MLTVLFYTSFLLITTLVGVKMYEISAVKRTALSKMFLSFDGKTEAHMNALKTYFERERMRVRILITHELPKQLHITVIHAKESAQKKYQSIIPNIRGVRILNPDRNASSFLQNLSIERQRDGKGRIEDVIINR